jgi:hypothetical protein
MGVTHEDWVECPPGHLSDDHELKQPGYCPAVFFCMESIRIDFRVVTRLLNELDVGESQRRHSVLA